MTETFLGIIAFSTLIMALIQVSVLVAVYLVMRRVERGLEHAEESVRPLLAKVENVTREAAESIAAAREQINRGGEVVADILGRVNETVGRVDHMVQAPAREGAAIVAGARAVVHALRRPFTAARNGSTHADTGDAGDQTGGHHVGKMRASGVSM
jgi:hypothetical protein